MAWEEIYWEDAHDVGMDISHIKFTSDNSFVLMATNGVNYQQFWINNFTPNYTAYRYRLRIVRDRHWEPATLGQVVWGTKPVINQLYALDKVIKSGGMELFIERELKNAIPTTPGSFTSPTSGVPLSGGNNVKVAWGTSTDADGDSITYALEVSINGGNYQLIRDYAQATELASYLVPTNANTVRFRAIAKDSKGGASQYGYSETFTVIQNSTPTATLNTTNNQTLYESNSITLSGQASDADNGQIVNIRYQINAETIRALGTGISNGTDPIAFSKVLTFKLGKLYDGSTVVTGALADGVNHTLKVWAEDEKGARSAEQIRTFKVVANRSPILTLNPVTTASGLINNDALAIRGSTTDPEAQNLKVRYNINGGPFTDVHDGAGGSFSFNLPLSNLQTGANTIIVQAVDSYEYITSKTLSISKAYNGNDLLKGFARYKLTTPTAGITELVTWVEKTIGDLTVTMDASMVNEGQDEAFTAMSKTNNAPIDDGIDEDEFTLTAGAAKTSVAIKLDLSRTSASSTDTITRITGTFN